MTLIITIKEIIYFSLLLIFAIGFGLMYIMSKYAKHKDKEK